MKKRRIITLLLAVLCIAAPGALLLLTCGANIFSTDREIAIGSEFAKEIESRVRLLENNEWNDYIDEIGQRIASVCDRPNIEYHFNIVDDSTSINAFALPGGYIYVYTGLLLSAESEAEVAGVLAHEVGHVVGKHGVKRLTSMYGYQFIVAIALGSNPSRLEQMSVDILGGLGMLNYGRKNEFESDDYGVKYLYALGYDPRAFVSFFEKLAKLHADNPSFLEKYLSTHPQPADRIQRAQKNIALLPEKDDLVLKEKEYTKMRQSLYREHD